jgi:sulfite exporter TauE/SafE/copper chaperone CopZ
MEAGIKTKKLQISGMTCVNCQNIIQKKLRNTAGIEKAEVSYNTGTAVVTYDTDIISLIDIISIIKNLDYDVLTENERQNPNTNRIIGLLFIISLYFILEYFGFLNLLAPSQLAETNMEYGMLFVIGLITSVHCIAMCGGINLSQCVPCGNDAGKNNLSTIKPAFFYSLGRVVSYTAIGFAVGAFGSVIAFTSAMQGGLKLVAGVFMIIMGINMLGGISWLRKLTPQMPISFTEKVDRKKWRQSSPLIVGLLNGFMPCGPLQAMQIYALSTGNPFTGAVSMFLFSVGTVPLTFGLGTFTSLIGKKFTTKIMTVGAVLVVVFGLSMLTQGFSLLGFSAAGTFPFQNSEDRFSVIMENEVQVINSTLTSSSYPAITVQAGIPVKWIIDAPQGTINGCNNRIFINEYGIEYTFTEGENIIEFTPDKTGTFQYSCWMGMIHSTITVVDN